MIGDPPRERDVNLGLKRSTDSEWSLALDRLIRIIVVRLKRGVYCKRKSSSSSDAVFDLIGQP